MELLDLSSDVYLEISGFFENPNLEFYGITRFSYLPDDARDAIIDDIATRDPDNSLNLDEVDVELSPDNYDKFVDYMCRLVERKLLDGTLQDHFIDLYLSEYIESQEMLADGGPELVEKYIGIENPIKDDLIGYDYVIYTDINLTEIAEQFASEV